MNKDYKELVEFLGKKFDKVDERFNKIETKLDNKADKEITDKILASQDEIMIKLDNLLQEKTVSDAQDKRKTDVLKIHNEALKRNKILSDAEILDIGKLQAF